MVADLQDWVVIDTSFRGCSHSPSASSATPSSAAPLGHSPHETVAEPASSLWTPTSDHIGQLWGAFADGAGAPPLQLVYEPPGNLCGPVGSGCSNESDTDPSGHLPRGIRRSAHRRRERRRHRSPAPLNAKTASGSTGSRNSPPVSSPTNQASVSRRTSAWSSPMSLRTSSSRLKLTRGHRGAPYRRVLARVPTTA